MPKQKSVAKRGQICPRCGEIHERCLAHRNSDGKACTRHPIKGAEVCYKHGLTVQGRAKAAERYATQQAETKALAILQKQGVTTVDFVDPIGLLEDTIAEKVRLKNTLSGLVGKLETWRYESDGGTEQVRGELVFYIRMLNEVSKDLADYMRLGLEERRTRATETQLREVATKVTTALNEAIDTLTKQLPDQAPHIHNWSTTTLRDSLRQHLA